ncbi:response regulator [Trinickia fusca]|uniref:Response regulator n=1 Tax=Trinickia fusca TaxID=2419777 RepID=A0A494X910_9BURK|nr:response regulator [Trinickia fusca]RKP44866.1 response regulator [Trinickia fusca]
MSELDLTPKRASVLVATESVADAELIEKLLLEEFDNVHVSTKPEMAVSDFDERRPCVLVLAFDTLDAARHYYLGLYRLGSTVYAVPHRTVVLCGKHDLWKVYELCTKEYFDDYVLFWPATNDAPRIRMAVHHALRHMRAQTAAGQIGLRPPPEPLGEVAPAATARVAETARVATPGPAAALAEATIEAPYAKPYVPSGMNSGASVEAAPERRPVVLLVEDDAFQRKLLSQLLAGQNVELVCAATGTEAQALMWQHKPDLVLMDVGLPDTSGVEATRRIKAIAQFAHVQIVMVTGHSERNIVVESLKAGAADFLVKPFDKNTLLEKLRLFLPAGVGSPPVS